MTLKVTVLNVSKLSEDALYEALENLCESSPLYTMIDAELNKRAEASVRLEEARRAHEKAQLELAHAVQREIESILKQHGHRITDTLVENFGAEFAGDYDLNLNKCEVTSFATLNKVVVHNFDTPEQAKRYHTKLIYYRIHNKFIRDSSVTSLELLKGILGV